MNTLTRTLTGVSAAAVVFLASWAVTAAVSNSGDASKIDPPIDVPGATSEQATVLNPVASGDGSSDAGHLDMGLSEWVEE